MEPLRNAFSKGYYAAMAVSPERLLLAQRANFFPEPAVGTIAIGTAVPD